jgi:hypothetical protein
MGTKKDLLKEFSLMENERKLMLSNMEKFPMDILEKKPNATEWSVAEVIMHLVVAESASLAYMSKKLEVGGHAKASFGAEMKQRLLNLVIRLPIKYKAPKVAQLKEGETISYVEAVSKWTDVRNAMQQAYESLDEALVNHELFKHPAAGKISALQGLRFMRQHATRHIDQINRTAQSA